MVVAVQLSVPGLYRPPVFKIIKGSHLLLPRRSFRYQSRLRCDGLGPSGALVVLVGVQLFVPGLYLPPVLTEGETFIPTAPDNHFGPRPYCRVARSCARVRQSCL